ncbi:Uncharacterised protein [Mycobacteroides abscessus subsp. abscessus]|nr:Uncharacterised protein [Mycobacteroides abscessus subsp. abscessus]
MAFGAEDVESAEFDDLCGLRLDLLLRLGEDLLPLRLVLLGVVDGVEPALLHLGHGDELGVAAEHDVGAAASHVRRHSDRALPAGQRDDRRLTRVVLGVEDLVAHPALGEVLREVLALLDARRAHEHRLTGLMALDDVVDDGVELRDFVLVDEVRLVDALHRLVRRDGDDAELVGRHELRGLGLGGAGHARELVVEPEVVLQRDRRQGLVLGLDLDLLLGLDRLVQALVVAPPLEHTSGVLVDDEDLAVEEDVVLVLLEQLLGADGVVEEADERSVLRVVEVADAEVVLDALDAGFEDADGALLLVDLVVPVGLEAADDLGELLIPSVRVALGGAGDDERGAGLVDEDRVDLIDDGEGMAALDELLGRPRHVVAEVIEAELVVRAVGDVRGVLLPSLVGGHVRLDAARLHPEEAEDAAHELRLVGREVVVDGDDVDAAAGERVEVGGGRGHERFALTGLHLGDVAEVECGSAHELDVEVPHAQCPARGLAHRGEGLRQQRVE